MVAREIILHFFSGLKYLLNMLIDSQRIMDYIVYKLIIFVGDEGIHTKARPFFLEWQAYVWIFFYCIIYSIVVFFWGLES